MKTLAPSSANQEEQEPDQGREGQGSKLSLNKDMSCLSEFKDLTTQKAVISSATGSKKHGNKPMSKKRTSHLAVAHVPSPRLTS